MKETHCENCKYFVEHYIKGDGRFRKLIYGHCTKKRPYGRICNTDSACKLFEIIDVQEVNQQKEKSIAKRLECVSILLTELCEFLSD